MSAPRPGGVWGSVSVCFVAVCVAAGGCSLVERRLFTFVVLDVLSVLLVLVSSGAGGGVEPRGGLGWWVWAHCWVLRDQARECLVSAGRGHRGLRTGVVG